MACAYRGGNTTGKMYDSQGNVCNEMDPKTKIMVIAASSALGVALVGLAIWGAFWLKKRKEKKNRISVVPARPLSAWGGGVANRASRMTMGELVEDARRQRESVIARNNPYPQRSPSMTMSSSGSYMSAGGMGSPGQRTTFLLPPGDKSVRHSVSDGSMNGSLNGSMKSPPSPMDSPGLPILSYEDRRHSNYTPPRQAWQAVPGSPGSPDTPRGPSQPPTAASHLTYYDPPHRPKSAMAEGPTWRYPSPQSSVSSSMSPPLLSPLPLSSDEYSSVSGTPSPGPDPKRDSAQSKYSDEEEMLQDIASSTGHEQSEEFETHSQLQQQQQQQQQQVQQPMYAPRARYEQRRLSFIPILEETSADLANADKEKVITKKYSYADDEKRKSFH